MKKVTFEKSLEKLEKIVEDLESGDLELDVSLKKYEEGIKLARACQKELEGAKEKIEMLVKDKNGQIKKKKYQPEGK